MTLGCYLTLDQGVIYNDNYSSDSSLKLTGTFYSDIGKTTAFNLTGYTIKLRIHRDGARSDLFNQTCTITIAASGTFYLNVTSGTLPYPGMYLVTGELAKSGTVVSSLNRVELLVRAGP